MRITTLAALCTLLLACGSSSGGGNVRAAADLQIPEPSIEFIQLVGPADLQYPAGEIEVRYGLRIHNESSEPMKLRRIRLEPISAEGPYAIRRNTYYFGIDVPPGKITDMSFWAKAVADGDPQSIDARAPVQVRAALFFDTPDGTFRTIVSGYFSQNGGAVRSQ